MSRPTTLLKDNTVYWVIRLFNSSQVLVDADSTPTVAIRKNGASTADSVTVTKRAATTGIYDCSYNPSSEIEGDQFCVEETATISSQAYENAWSFVVKEAERGTDSAFLAASAPGGQVTVGTNNDKTGYSISGTKNTLDDLNDVSTAEVNTQVDLGLSDIGLDHLVDSSVTGSDIADNSIIARMVSKSATADWDSFDNTTDALEALADAGLTTGAIADALWDELFSGHNVAGSFGKIVRQIYEGVVSQDGSVNDASATTTTFVTNLTQATDGFYHDKVIVFVSGSLAGQARHIETYVGSTKSITVSQAFTSAPANADEFLILATHEHSLVEIREEIDNNSTQLAAIVADTNELQTDWTNGGRLDLILDSVLALLDDARSEPGQGSPPVNPDAMTKLDYLYKAWRNKKTQTATTFSLFDDAGTTVDHKSTVSDDGTTATIGEIATGP